MKNILKNLVHGEPGQAHHYRTPLHFYWLASMLKWKIVEGLLREMKVDSGGVLGLRTHIKYQSVKGTAYSYFTLSKKRKMTRSFVPSSLSVGGFVLSVVEGG